MLSPFEPIFPAIALSCLASRASARFSLFATRCLHCLRLSLGFRLSHPPRAQGSNHSPRRGPPEQSRRLAARCPSPAGPAPGAKFEIWPRKETARQPAHTHPERTATAPAQDALARALALSILSIYHPTLYRRLGIPLSSALTDPLQSSQHAQSRLFLPRLATHPYLRYTSRSPAPAVARRRLQPRCQPSPSRSGSLPPSRTTLAHATHTRPGPRPLPSRLH